MATNLIAKIRTAHALGITSLGRYFFYKLGLFTGINPVKKLSASIPPGPFYDDRFNNYRNLTPSNRWLNHASYFGWKNIDTSQPPNWYLNPFLNKSSCSENSNWWDIKDFDAQTGDIKTIWEASRFDWVVAFAQNIASGNKQYLEKLNNWLTDWTKYNKPYKGVNWKCGQEASIRVMHLAFAALTLEQVENTKPSLIALIKAHLQRISPTVRYAIAQDNNHGTSEAAALFIGGSWLVLNNEPAGNKWVKQGRKWLENRARSLIENDGSFSQYSVTYHRLMLDTYSFAEVWRKKFKLNEFSETLNIQLQKASQWLYQLVEPDSGDAPNLGANDGARLLPLTNADYRDFRPSVQLSMAIFNGCSAYHGKGSWNLQLYWLGQKTPDKEPPKRNSIQFGNGGYSLLRQNNAFALLRIPSFHFRPSHSDVLHLDFWVASRNVLRDGGTFSYAAPPKDYNYFSGTASHNTFQFDNRNQMPRLSRFLFGNWIKPKTINPVEDNGIDTRCSASYKDCHGANHSRTVILNKNKLLVKDKVSGFDKSAKLRWRLEPVAWKIKGHTLFSETTSISIHADVEIKGFELIDGFESRYYYQKTSLPVLEVEIGESATITTEIVY